VTAGTSAFFVSVRANVSHLVALNFGNGVRQWQRAITGTAYHAPVVAGSSVIVQSNTGVYAFSIADGTPRWSQTSLPATLCAAGNMVMAGTTLYAFTDTTVNAIDGTTGAVRWSTPVAVYCVTGLAVSGGRVFAVSRSEPDPAGAQQGELRSLDAQTGVVLWTTATPATMDGDPAAGSGAVFVSTQYDTQGMVAFDQQTGRIRWQRTDVLAYDQAPAATANAVIVTSAQGSATPSPTVRALNPATGAPLWSRTIPGATAGGDPVIANGLVYFGSRGDPKVVYAVRLDNGSQVATLALGTGAGNNEINPIVINGTVLAAVTPEPGSGSPIVPTLQALRLP
jgi:outer membrane protein assembly factor BamB